MVAPVLALGAGRPGGPSPAVRYRVLVDEPDFEEMVAVALEGLPEPFRERLGSVAIVVEDEPTREQLAATGARGLYGLYQGVPRTAYGADAAAVPSKITLFRGPLTRSARTPAALARLVTETVYHEVAHHLGISDARLRELHGDR